MSAPAHVLMTTDAVGGVWTYSLDLARALAPHGVRISLAAMGPRPAADQRNEALRIPGLELHASEYKLEWMDDPWADVDAAAEWLLDLESRLSPDLVHVNGFAHGAVAWKSPCIVVAHSCVVSWWNAVHGCNPPASWSMYRQRVRAGLLACDAVVAVSRAMARSVLRHYGVPGVLTIPNARDSAAYHPAAKQPLILTSGRAWDPAKNITALDTAAESVPWPVVVVGEMRNPQGGTACIRHARTVGQLSARQLRSWFAKASIYALPALYEPFGLSVLEAALSSCALVLGDIASLRENWGGAAWFVNPRDSRELASALRDLSANRAQREELGKRARLRALQFSPERMATSYLAGYSRVRSGEAATCAS